MVVFVKRTRALQTIEQVKAHAKYVGFRAKEASEKGFFDEKHDNADYIAFINRIKDNTALRHPLSVKAQKLVFSLRQSDYEAYKRSGHDYKYLIRNVLKEYENKYGLKLDWIANIHESEGHPHVHVIIKGVSDKKGSRGYTRIKFTKERLNDLRHIFDKLFERDVQYMHHEEEPVRTAVNDVGRALESFTWSIKREIVKQQAKNEFEKMLDDYNAERDKYKDSGR